MPFDERVLTFYCEGESLLGVLSGASPSAARGVVIVVGGPQYRSGSHRQFTLLARDLAGQGVPTFRFDYRGMGDSSGAPRTFENVDSDIRCAIDAMFDALPGLKDVVIWGLCDAASAALFYAHQDRRVSGVVMLNPWVHTEQGSASVYLRHYYVKRIFQASLWQKIKRGEFDIRRAVASLWGFFAAAAGRKSGAGTRPAQETPIRAATVPYVVRMEEGLRKFGGRVLIILSGNDFTAQEFKDLVARSVGWRRLLSSTRVTRHDIAVANHTFSRREWRDQVAEWTATWVKSY